MSAPPRLLRLGRAQRLVRAREFAQIKEKGHRLAKGCLIANWRDRPAGMPSRVGVIASRRLGSAVRRNRARRLLREAFRLHQHDFRQAVDLVLVARGSIVGCSRAKVEHDLLRILHQSRLLKDFK